LNSSLAAAIVENHQLVAQVGREISWNSPSKNKPIEEVFLTLQNRLEPFLINFISGYRSEHNPGTTLSSSWWITGRVPRERSSMIRTSTTNVSIEKENENNSSWEYKIQFIFRFFSDDRFVTILISPFPIAD